MMTDKLIKEMIELIDDMNEDLMAFYRWWQENRDFEGYLSLIHI